MPSLPPIEPHTAAKHHILKRYLDAWFVILGKTHNRINYIDGFCGPGKYEGEKKGSPLIAIESACDHIQKGNLRPGVQINFLFIDKIKKHTKSLEQILGDISLPPGFEITIRSDPFREVIEGELTRLQGNRNTLDPTFAFVDPCGFSGIPFGILRRILRSPKCEIFVNIMVEFINRFLEHPSEDVVAHFPETFGTEDILKIPTQSANRVDQILELYRDQLRKCAKYVNRFDIRNKRDRNLFSLFFATQSNQGLLKMKEAMWSIDKSKGRSFSDADPFGFSQLDLFGLDPLWHDLHKTFSRRTVPMTEIDRYVIEETDYLTKHVREILRNHEASRHIQVVHDKNYKRRKGTFKDDKVSIFFVS